MIPVNLYVDRMSPVQPVRVADVYAITQDRAAEYREAAAKIGLTVSEYGEFRSALTGGEVDYVVLPRHIDAMAGVHRRTGRVYALRNVLVPSGEMGWKIGLADGTTVYVPRVCGNLSMNRARKVAAVKPHVVAHHGAAHRPVVVADAPVPVAVEPAPVPAPVAVTFAPPPAPAVPLAVGTGSIAPYFAPVVPFVYGLVTRNAPVVPSCSLGSNTLGVCR